ncbi:MAG: hypothetical protein P1U53_17475, partial [Sulfitobacter sp.]|nr:hypothetical protein [Sulfitobacter sp.]
MEVVDCHKEDLAKEYERREIYRLRPRFNHQHNPDKGNWTPPSRPRADRPNETDRVLWIMQNKPLWEWPAEYRADYCRMLQHNWRRNGFP